MKSYKSFNEMAEGTGALSPNVENMAFVDNMSPPAIDQYVGYSIHIPVFDHEPPHVHIKKGKQKFGKLLIAPANDSDQPDKLRGMPDGDLQKIKEHIKVNQDEYMKKWKEFHGE